MSLLLSRLKHWMSYNASTEFYYRHYPQLLENAEFLIRPMQIGDIVPVHALEKRVYEFPWEIEAFRDCIKMRYPCWVGERGGIVCAYGILSVAAGESHILNLCISPEIQGRGLGRLVLEHLANDAKTRGADVVFLEVRSSNTRAIGLYQNSGFNEIGLRKGYYPASKGREDAIVMARML